jgi:hypothetical protein
MALAAITCGVAFLLALFRQFGLVEVAASLGAGAEVFFLSSSIGDLLEVKKESNRTRFIAALLNYRESSGAQLRASGAKSEPGGSETDSLP